MSREVFLEGGRVACSGTKGLSEVGSCIFNGAIEAWAIVAKDFAAARFFGMR